MRGKALTVCLAQFFFRITPAYAGKSHSLHAHFSMSRDHPRLCGEKRIPHTRGVALRGSPPPMRGKVLVYMFLFQYHGITPAYAGKSARNSAVNVSHRDHPRLCGEKQEFRAHVALPVGSPPPMRGKVLYTIRELLSSGITPAYAGKSHHVFNKCRIDKDHPRLCGEKFRIHSFITCQPGSPPPMRGKAGEAWQKNNQSRITPAYAGKSRSPCYKFSGA